MTDPIDTARDIDDANRLIGLIVVALCAGLAGLVIGFLTMSWYIA